MCGLRGTESGCQCFNNKTRLKLNRVAGLTCLVNLTISRQNVARLIFKRAQKESPKKIMVNVKHAQLIISRFSIYDLWFLRRQFSSIKARRHTFSSSVYILSLPGWLRSYWAVYVCQQLKLIETWIFAEIQQFCSVCLGYYLLWEKYYGSLAKEMLFDIKYNGSGINPKVQTSNKCCFFKDLVICEKLEVCHFNELAQL